MNDASAVALVLAAGLVLLGALTGYYQLRGLRALAARVTVHDDPDAAPPPAHRTARVVVRLRGGEELRAETRVVRGDAANPVDREVLREKFRFLAGRRLDAARVPEAERVLLAIDGVADTADLHRILCA